MALRLSFRTREAALALSLLVLGVATPVAAGTEPAGSTGPPAADNGGRLIVLGFDGADGRTVEALMDEGQLPNLARLRDQGTFTPLGVVTPPESPVSWAALNTGRNPAKTGVPGFAMREFKDDGEPGPTLGHLVEKNTPIEELDAPIPTWSPMALGGAVGAGVFLLFLIFFAALLRMRLIFALPLSLILGGGGFYAGHTARGYLPETVRHWGNPNQAPNFWDLAADAGVDAIVLDAAQSFDMPSKARVLSGLGVPDARGAIGDWFIYTNDELVFERPPRGKSSPTAGTIFRVDWRDGQIASKVYGPPNFWAEDTLLRKLEELGERIADPQLGYQESFELQEEKRIVEDELDEVRAERTSVDLVVQRDGNAATVTIDGESQRLEEGEWSDFYSLSFELNPLLKVKAVTRVKLMDCNDELFRLFVNTLDIDPSAPPFWQPISTPNGFSRQLAEMHGGPFETYGWPTLTMPFKDREIGAETLLEDVEFTLEWREELTMACLARDDWRLLFSVFSTTDRVQHMTYQYYDEEHPLYDSKAAASEVEFFGETIALKEAIPAIYRQMDRVVGRVMESLAPDDTLMICSDHGFQTFRRQVHLNNWLEDKGYLVVKEGLSGGDAKLLDFVDWSKTRAYALGLGFVYLNLQGREKGGIVAPEDAPKLLAEIRSDLLATTEDGAQVCSDAYILAERRSGPYLSKEADLICGFAPPYRVSWSSTMGSMNLDQADGGAWAPGPIYEDNESPWSGGHVSLDVEKVRGVFFSNRKVDVPEDGGVHALHLAPTSLDVLGVDRPSELDRGPLSFRE